MPDVDIVIVNYRSASYTAACVAAAHRTAREDGVQVTVTVVDNGDLADVAALLESHGPTVLVRNPRNLGFGAACNKGAALGSAPLILFLNPDATLKPGALKALSAFLTNPQNARMGIVGPAIENEAGGIARTSSALPSVIGLLRRTLGLSDGFLSARDHAASGPVGQIMGAVLMIRRSVFERLGGFDPRFFLYYEDVDLCARAAAAGYATYYLPSARAVHIGRVSSSQDPGLALALFLRSRFTYARTHFGILAQGFLVAVSYLAELPMRLLSTFVGAKSITGLAVLRAYRLLTISLISGAGLGAQPRER